MSLSSIGPFITRKQTKRKQQAQEPEQPKDTRQIAFPGYEPQAAPAPQEATAKPQTPTQWLMQALPSLLGTRQPSPSEVPIPPLFISMRTLASMAASDAANKQQPGPLEIESARARAAYTALQQAGMPELFPAVEPPDLPTPPAAPTQLEPPRTGPLARPGVADFIGAAFGLIRPQYAGQFASATLQGRMAAQADDFAKKRQYWQDMMTAEQNAYSNNLQRYNQEVARAMTLHGIKQRNRDIASANEELRRNAMIPLYEKEALAKEIGNLAAQEADAMTANQRAKALAAAADAMDSQYVREMEFLQKIAPSMINAIGMLAATSTSAPIKQANVDLREREVAIKEKMLPFQIADIQSKVGNRLAMQNIASGKLQVALQALGLASQRLAWDKDKFAAWLKTVNIPPKAKAALEQLQAKVRVMEDLKKAEIAGPLLGVLTPEAESRLGTAIRNLNTEIDVLGDAYADAFAESQAERAAAAGIQTNQRQARPPASSRRPAQIQAPPASTLRQGQAQTEWRGTLNGQPIIIRRK